MSTATLDVDALYRQHRRQIYGSAYNRLGDHHAAEDAVQDAFLQAWEQRDTYEARPDTPPVAWVATLAKYQALTTLRKRKRYVLAGDWTEEFAEQEDRDTSTGLPCAADPETCAATYTALATLPDQQRLVLQMECLQGMSRAEVARCLRLRSWDVADLSMRGMRRLQRRTAAEQGPSRTSVDAGNAPVDRPPAGEIDAETAARFRARPDIMAALTERQHQAVGLRLFDGLSLSQVGARMGVSPQSVRQFILVAMKRLDAGVVEHEHNPGPPASEHVLRILNNPELLAGLSPRHREAIVLRYREGLNVEDTAQRMGTTYRAVTAMVCKVRDHERTRLAALESQAVAA